MIEFYPGHILILWRAAQAGFTLTQELFVASLYTSWDHSPTAISAAAWLYNYSCSDISGAAILEIGCGNGANLIRHATIYPQSTCVGVDIDAQRIEAAQNNARQSEMNNLHLYCMGLQDLLSIDAGRFDYIIIPAMYTLLDNSARSALMLWCQRQLNDNGIIAVRWNTLPGARSQKILQQAIAFHCAAAQSEQAWLTSARAMLTFMEMTDSRGEVKAAAASAQKLTDAELLGQYLEDNQDACLLSDFAQRVKAERLQLLGDVVPQSELAEHYGAPIALLHQTVASGSHALQAQQYLDFAVQRSERFSLLISAKSGHPFSHRPELNQLKTMHWAASCALTEDENQRITRYGEKVNTRSPDIRRLFDWLSAAWPRSLSTEQLIQLTLEPENPVDHRERMMVALEELFLNKPPSLYLSAAPSPYNRAEGELKLICDFSTTEVADGAYCARTNGWGERLAFKREEFAAWQRWPHPDNLSDARYAIELAGKGLLIGSATSWAHFWQRIIACGDRALIEGAMRAFLLATSAEKQGGLLSASMERSLRAIKPRVSVNPKKASKAQQLLNAGHIQQAREDIAGLLIEHPTDSTLLMLAAAACNKAGDNETALTLLARRLGQGGDLHSVLNSLARVLTSLEAKSSTPRLLFQQLLKQDDKNGERWLDLSSCFHAIDDKIREEQCLQASLKHDAKNSICLLRLATLYSHTGRMEEAKALCTQALALPMGAINRLNSHALYLFLLSHDAVLSAEEKFHAHVDFGVLASQWAQSTTLARSAQTPSDGRGKIRIGFVSGDLRGHPVHHFIYPVWHSINRDRYELYAYATGREDRITQQYRDIATVFRSVAALSALELAQQIASDNIDVLIDLSGFTEGNRLLTFALKPAALQMSWIGFVGTTGLQQMDYYIAHDHLMAPGELDAIFTEKLVSLPSAKIFEYSSVAPEVGKLPALKNGYLTLGNFNRPQKLTPAILDCWAKILRTLPHARLLFAYMDDERMIDSYRVEMTRRGVNPEQLDFRMKQSFADYLAMHNEVDILLDSHPYSAGTTAQHACWMGVPLVTTTEGSAVSRTTAATMKTFNLGEFVTASLDEYAEKVIELDRRYDCLSAIRQSLRARIKQREASHSHNAVYFEQMIETVWQRHQAGEAPSALFIEDQHRWDEQHDVIK